MNEQTKNNSSPQSLNTEGGKSKSNTIEMPSISLPKGGGAIKGIDEKFTVNSANGTASFSIPLPVSAARGVSPALNLNYNSGAGNGIFGLGWSLSLSSIKRKTENGLPKYLDAADSDTLLFSEAEDLVPEFKKHPDGSFETDIKGDYVIHEKNSPDNLCLIRYYKPRIEGIFARIERWTVKISGHIKWRVITSDNVTTLFGWSDNSRIFDPQDERKVFEWLPEFVFDDKGNCAHYIYKKENADGFLSSLLHNSNRLNNGQITYTNTYLEKVLYGNISPYKKFEDVFPDMNDYLFSTVFDYGEYNPESPFEKIKDWNFRPDAFSYYKSGFEIRTTRLCKRVLLFHHFKGPNEYEGLVSSLNFSYETNSEEDFAFLKSIISFGYIKKTDGSYSKRSIPPMTFEYQSHDWNQTVKSIDSKDLVHAPVGLDEQQYQFTDLFNEGLAGILTEQATGWYYKHNLGNGEFEQAKLITPKPSFSGLGVRWQLAEIAADGHKQLVSYNAKPAGFFELDDNNEWKRFKAFKSLPNIDYDDPNTRMLDLNGDGMPEIVLSEDDAFTWYTSEGRDGYSYARKTYKSYDEELGPHIVFSDAEQSVFLADMSGDGMTDIVRIRNGEVCYWPNLGYGKFGAKVSLDNSPVFDHQDLFNPAYIRLADIDGSGTTDIIYLGKNKFTCWKNLCGNSFNPTPFEIDTFPDIHLHSEITVTDLLGNGVACIVWSSLLSKDSHAPLRYIDLMNSKKPHILISYKNNLGKEVNLEYTPSTKFYIDDKKAGKPWITKLHFPIQCISKSITEDKVSGYKFINQYKYHHGYYDHAEKEFRGFGMVEQTDAETFEHWKKSNASNIVEEPLHQEPVVSKTWIHTGAFLRKDEIINQFKDDYWYKEMANEGFPVTHFESDLPDAIIVGAPGIDSSMIDKLSAQELQEAIRACKGMNLRHETFALDAEKNGNTEDAKIKELTPFSVSANNFIIELIQPKGNNQHAIFVVKESEAIIYNYDRNYKDPRVDHKLNIKLDQYGNVLESAAIVYPRFLIDPSLPIETQQEQGKTLISYTKNQFTNDVISDDAHLLRLPSEVKTFELKGVTKVGVYFTSKDFKDILSDLRSDSALYHETNKPLTIGKAQRRIVEHVRSIYLKNDLTGPLALHQLESLAIPFESYQLAYTPELITDIFGTKVNDAILDEGKFSHSEGDNNWWIRSGTVQFLQGAENAITAQNRFYVPVSYTNPYGAVTRVKYYGSYYLSIEETEDALGNKSSVETFNFRTLFPKRMKDINGNFSEVITDELGLVKAVAVMGKGTEADDLTDLEEHTDSIEMTEIQNFFQASDSTQLTNIGKVLLKHATSRFVYDFESFINNGKPAVVAAISREEHFQKNPDSPVQIGFEYSNGIGEVVLKKSQVEPGKAKQVIVHPDNTITINEIDTQLILPIQLRWMGNGRSLKNNKGNVVKKYEPYFSLSKDYEGYAELVETGVTTILYYDAAGRLIKSEMPDGTISKIVFDSWKQMNYDANDTILESAWYHNRINHLIDALLISEGKDPAREKQAADKAAKHANTPDTLYFDTLGRPVLTADHNKNITTEVDELYNVKVQLDIEGNLKEVTDARGNTVMQYKYDMLGNLVYQKSLEAGQRWLMVNILGSPLRTWDERMHEIQYFYDILNRTTHCRILGGDGENALDNIVKRTIYGESLLLPDRTNEAAIQAGNLLGKPVQQFDTAGLLDTPEYDFKGQALSSTRKLFKKYKETANWNDANLVADLESKAFTFLYEADAMGRFTRQESPDGSIITPIYNEAGLLKGENVLHPGDLLPTTYIKNIEYNEKRHRSKIIYGNDVITRFTYDRESFRLIHLETKRQNGDPLQDWYYTYDPAGNISHIENRNIPVIFFNNQKVTGVSEYTYDAIYQLVEAKGRENDAAFSFNNRDIWNDSHFMHHINPGDPMAVRNYTETYRYDEAGNILEMHHQSAGNTWTRKYNYPANSNRLTSTQIGNNNYNYSHHPQHGFITEMPHLEEMKWNFKEELVKTIRQKRSDGGTPETTYYQYDGHGNRIRKITENTADAGVIPSGKEERIYLAGYEHYRKLSNSNAGLERITLSLMDEGHRFVMVETRNDVDDGTEKKLVRYQLHNHLGSAALELDNSAQVISYEEYHPFGTTAYQAKNNAIKSTAKRYRFTGMERDEETGLEYHTARYYIPWLGRWLNSDPIGISDGVNTFRYVANNPVILHDPSGTNQKDWVKVETEDPDATYYENINTGTVIRQAPGIREVWASTSGVSGQYEAVAAEYRFADDPLFAKEKPVPVPPPEPEQEIPDEPTPPESETSNLETAADIATDFIPFVGSGKDLYRGIRDGDALGIALGAGGLILDIATLGGGSLIKGGIKTVVKQGTRQLAKGGIEQIVISETKHITKDLAEEGVKQVVKEGTEKATKYASPSVLGTLVGTSVSQMRRAAAKKIHTIKNHPLKFLLDSKGNFKKPANRSHSTLINRPDVVEMGHIVSKKAGGTERIMLQSAWDNQFNNVTAEGLQKGGKNLGIFMENVAVDIGGVAVDLKTAQWWVREGLLSKEILENAPRLVF